MPYIESETKAKIREISNSAEIVIDGITEEVSHVELKKEHFHWLIEQAEHYQKISDTWKNNINVADYETVQFLRVCKEVIEGVGTPKRSKRI